MKTTRGATTVAVLLAALVLSACGGDDADDGATPTTPPTETETVAPTETAPPTETQTPVETPSESEAEAATVSLYFANEAMGDVCTEAFPVDREVTGEDTLEATLLALLAGPTEDELADGYSSWFSDETADLLESVTVEDGRALVSFDPSLRDVIPNASSSCGSGALLGQLDRTLTQFPEVDEAWYSLGGDRDAFYEWLQMSAPE